MKMILWKSQLKGDFIIVKTVGGVIHSDVYRSLPLSKRDLKYNALSKTECSRYVTVSAIMSKVDALKCFQDFEKAFE